MLNPYTRYHGLKLCRRLRGGLDWQTVVYDATNHDGTNIILILLFISYKFVKGFLAITFFITCFLELKLSWCVSTFFYTTRNEISVGSDKKWEIFIDDVTKVGDFYNGGLWGKSLPFVGSSWIFFPGYIKKVDTHHESFNSKKQVIKK